MFVLISRTEQERPPVLKQKCHQNSHLQLFLRFLSLWSSRVFAKNQFFQSKTFSIPIVKSKRLFLILTISGLFNSKLMSTEEELNFLQWSLVTTLFFFSGHPVLIECKTWEIIFQKSFLKLGRETSSRPILVFLSKWSANQVQIYFGSPRLGHTIKMSCTILHTVNPEIYSVLIF